MTSSPPLCDGDLLDQPEFHRRYLAMPKSFWAELIAGKVYVMSPVYGEHSDLHGLVDGWLSQYMFSTPGVKFRPTPSTILGPRSEPQPDAVLFILPEFGGRVHFDEHRCTVGAPELVVEVCVSTEAHDLKVKLQEYERAGVNEYIVVLPRRKAVRWFQLEANRFKELRPVDGLYRSTQFPGLWLDPTALLSEDVPPLLAALNLGLQDSAHAEFVAKLQSQRKRKLRRK
jgi:Uma2 family endonuclease